MTSSQQRTERNSDYSTRKSKAQEIGGRGTVSYVLRRNTLHFQNTGLLTIRQKVASGKRINRYPLATANR